MDMVTILTALFGSGAAAAVVIFLGRKLIDSLLSKDLETFKTQLQLASQRELELLRTQLERESTEHRVRFTRLHERQAEVVAEVFGGLERLHGAYLEWMQPVKAGDVDMFALGKAAAKAYNDFTATYYPRAIWLDPDTCDAINGILQKLTKNFWRFMMEVDEQGYPKNRRLWMETWEAVSVDVSSARKLLDVRFRTLLGVTSVPAPTVQTAGGA